MSAIEYYGNLIEEFSGTVPTNVGNKDDALNWAYNFRILWVSDFSKT